MNSAPTFQFLYIQKPQAFLAYHKIREWPEGQTNDKFDLFPKAILLCLPIVRWMLDLFIANIFRVACKSKTSSNALDEGLHPDILKYGGVYRQIPDCAICPLSVP